MSKKIAAAAVAAFLLSQAVPAFSENFEFPIKPEDRGRVMSLLLSDGDFARDFVMKYATTHMGGLKGQITGAEEMAAAAHNMKEGPTGGMEPGSVKIDSASQTKVTSLDGAPRMTSDTNMSARNGMIRTGSPQKTAAAPDTTPMFADSPVNPAEAGAMAANVLPSQPPKHADVTPSPLKADRVDLFISLTCPYCSDLWKNLRANQSTKSHLMEDRVNVWVLPRSNSEAGVALIYQIAYDQDPEKGYQFIDHFFEKRKEYAGMNEGEVFGDFNNWMQENGVGSILDLRGDKDRIAKLGKSLETGLELGKIYGIQAFPSVYVDGKIDDEWFTKVDNAAKKDGKKGK